MGIYRDEYNGIFYLFSLSFGVLANSTHPQVGTHADSLIAEAVLKGVQGFDREIAWEAVWKDATVPPKDDSTVS